MKLFLTIGLYLGSIGIIAQSNDRISFLDFNLLSKSTIEFNGASTINTFCFRSASLKGNGAYIIDNNLDDSSYYADISVDVNSFDSGSKMMNSDMYEALKYEKYPVIDFKLFKINNIEKPDSFKQNFNANITGVLTIAGKSNNMEIDFNIGKFSDSTFYLKGNKSISMLDFKVEPPSIFFGLIQVDDSLNVNFNLYVELKKSFFYSTPLIMK